MITTTIAVYNVTCSAGADYPTTFSISEKTEVHVYRTNALGEDQGELVYVEAFTGGATNEFKVTDVEKNGFTVELRDSYSDGKISIRRETDIDQQTRYKSGTDFPAAAQEKALDKLTMIIQELNEVLNRQLGISLSDDAGSLSIPSFEANKYLGLNGSNEFVWKEGTVAVQNDEIKDSHIDWGTGSEQVSAVDMPIADAGSHFTGTDVETALQEAGVHNDSDGKDHADVVLNNTHRSSDGKNHADVVLNNTHRSSDGTDHSYIDQDIKKAASPQFAGLHLYDQSTNADRNIEFASDASMLWDESEDTFKLDKSLDISGTINTGRGDNEVDPEPEFGKYTRVMSGDYTYTLTALAVGQTRYQYIFADYDGTVYDFAVKLPSGGTYGVTAFRIGSSAISYASNSVAGGTTILPLHTVNNTNGFYFVVYRKLT